MLLKSSAEAKNTRLTNQELSKVVDGVFDKFDENHDGQLSLAEFKNAVFTQSLIINPFWMSSSFKFGSEKMSSGMEYVNETACVKCRQAFIPSGIGEKYCGTCRKRVVTSPYATEKYSKI